MGGTAEVAVRDGGERRQVLDGRERQVVVVVRKEV